MTQIRIRENDAAHDTKHILCLWYMCFVCSIWVF